MVNCPTFPFRLLFVVLVQINLQDFCILPTIPLGINVTQNLSFFFLGGGGGVWSKNPSVFMTKRRTAKQLR